ncbi:MAG: isoleucine--tRNA ligase [Ruminococcaceae bacterium]|nr:isoleucine--tRNA ligase [Oscillospiraceae bacterium]
MEELDYGKTLNLPKTDFSMRANLPQKEPEMVKKWEEEKIYEKLMEENKGKQEFTLHDGPPFANGDIHLGHSLNKILKDIIVRFKNMDGYRAQFIPGWDTHGLPIEVQAIKKLKIKKDEVSTSEFRKICEEFAIKYINNQAEQFKRLGIIGDYEHPYYTLEPQFEGRQIEVFGKMANSGVIYKGMKPVYWCPDCETALAEAEIEYAEDKTNSIYVRFKVNDDKGVFEGYDKDKIYFVIWTTTTWTLPGNVAICLNPDFIYALVDVGGDIYVIARDLVDTFAKAANIAEYKILGEIEGSKMEYVTCKHPFIDRDSLVILGDHVTLDAGTGCVHTAPGHGAEDFVACQNYDLPIIVPVDSKGVLNDEAGKFAGMYYEKSNDAIIEELKSTNSLVAIEPIIHQYPHCWRCSSPIVFRATEQWFASVDKFKKAAVEAIKTVDWLPKWGEERITKMVEDRSDWCISRQRKWGVPIPIFYCEECGHELINEETIKIISKLFEEKGCGVWYEMDASEILPKGTKCAKCGCEHFTKETDIMDVWFDSGSSHYAVLAGREGLSWPADLYLEGNDQYRGWFQSSLLTSVALGLGAPYKKVITHGMVVDGNGKKMSKSLGNGMDPLEVAKKYGVDILRLWVVSSDYKTDVRLSEDILKQLSESYRKIRNTARYILGNISDFNPDTDMVSYENMLEIDKWALLKMNALCEKALEAYRSYEFHTLQHAIHHFCVVDMSNFYLDIIKDRLYTQKADSTERRSAQTAMYKILDSLVKLLAPVLCFTTEEIWNAMPHAKEDGKESVMFAGMPSVCDAYKNKEIEEKYDKLIALKNDVSKALEMARNEKIIGHSLGAKVSLCAKGEMYEFLKNNENDLVTVFIVSDVCINEGECDGVKGEETGVCIKVSNAEGEKCDRCWMISKTVGEDSEHPTLCKRCAAVVRSL